MRPIAIVLIVAALAISGVTVFLAKRFLDGQSAQQAAADAMPSLAVEKVLVAARDIGQGQMIGPDDLRYEDWPKSAIEGRFVLRGAGDDPKAAFVGAIARRAIVAGEPFSAPTVFRQDESGLLAGIISPGMRAVSIVATPQNSVSGFATPGDHVDVVLAADFRKGHDDKSRMDLMVKFGAEIIVRDARVVAVDQQLVRGKDPAMLGKTVTLEVTPKDAEKLLTAGLMGQVSLILRSLAEGAPPDAEAYTTDVMSSRVLSTIIGGGDAGGGEGAEWNRAPAVSYGGNRQVKINRAGVSSTQSFSN